MSERSIPEVPPVMQQIGLLNLRINDMMTQLNTVMKTMMDENAALKNENTGLKDKPGENNQGLKLVIQKSSLFPFFE